MVVREDDRRVGERVDGFQIRRPLGRGGAATVYEAESAEGVVALKIMHAHDPSGVGKQRFVREAALVSKLRHPHVIEILSYLHTADSVRYIVFELLRGN